MFTKSPSSLSSLSKAKRELALGLKRSPLFSWRYETHEVNQLLLVPRDLRTADPSLSIELDMGQFGLAGATVMLEGRSPFHVTPPNESWERELHGFGWLRNLRAARSERAFGQALDLLDDWLNSFKSQKGIAYQPEVAARRLISWFSYSNFLLHEADEARYLQFMQAIEEHMRYLAMAGGHAADGMPRLLSLISLVYAGLCVADQDQFAETQVRLMCAELDRQILPDGGHISRDNSVLASILLDLLPLKQCFVTLNHAPPAPLVAAINRMLPMIHYMRLGDGMMSRFNGAGTTLPDTLSTAMAYDDASNKALREARHSKYYRLQRGNVVVLMDGGSPPALGLSQKAHAGCLSFEMSSGTCPVIVNCGAAPPAYQSLASNARATVSHSTLTVNNRSSANFIHDKKPKNSKNPSLLDGPPFVDVHYDHDANSFQIVGSHDGYLERFGLVHHRLIALSKDGYTLTGEDWIEVPPQSKQVEAGLGWPFAVHFHIHPDVMTTRASDGKSLTLTLPDSQEWKFYAGGGLIYLEESTFYADFAGPCQAVQAVIRGTCLGPTSIPWKFTKVLTETSQPPRKLPSWLVETRLDDEDTVDAAAEPMDEITAETEAEIVIDDAEWEEVTSEIVAPAAPEDRADVNPEAEKRKASPRREASKKTERPPLPPKAEAKSDAKSDAKTVNKSDAKVGAAKTDTKSAFKSKAKSKVKSEKASASMPPPLPPSKMGDVKDDAPSLNSAAELPKGKAKPLEPADIKDSSTVSAKTDINSDIKAGAKSDAEAANRSKKTEIEPPLKRPKAMPIEEATKILKPRARNLEEDNAEAPRAKDNKPAHPQAKARDEKKPKNKALINKTPINKTHINENGAKLDRKAEAEQKDKSASSKAELSAAKTEQEEAKLHSRREQASAAALSLKAKRISLMEKLEKAARETAEITRQSAENISEKTTGERPAGVKTSDKKITHDETGNGETGIEVTVIEETGNRQTDLKKASPEKQNKAETEKPKQTEQKGEAEKPAGDAAPIDKSKKANGTPPPLTANRTPPPPPPAKPPAPPKPPAKKPDKD
ncbi:MAG: hypothetical protein DHS20C08_14280 [Rhodomicrobium sp.]|nr:MAG: hypothetical protein DHS20C08_14280 [Rhodomicrobium sp.]